MKSKTHIIQKQRYEIKTRRQNTAMDMQERLGEINTSYVLPLLAKKLDKHFSDQSKIAIRQIRQKITIFVI